MADLAIWRVLAEEVRDQEFVMGVHTCHLNWVFKKDDSMSIDSLFRRRLIWLITLYSDLRTPVPRRFAGRLRLRSVFHCKVNLINCRLIAEVTSSRFCPPCNPWKAPLRLS